MKSNKKRILYIITKSAPLGGAQKAVLDLAENFNKKYEVAVASGKGKDLEEVLDKENIKFFRIKSLGRNISFFKDIFAFFEIKKIIKEFEPDIIHLHSPKAAILGALAGRLSSVKKIIYTVHGWPFNEKRNAFQKILIKIICYKTVILCNKTIVISDAEKRQTKNWLFARKKISLIKNGIKEFELYPKDEARTKLSEFFPKRLDESKIWVGTIAELHRNKGLEYAIRALSNINLNYFIIGDGEEKKYLEELISSVGDQNIFRNVFLLGKIFDAKKYISAFDIFLIPSIKEGLPYTLLEAGLAKLPIIATRVGGIPDVIEDGKNGLLIKPENIKQIKDRILYIIENREKIETFGENLNKKIKENFSFENQMEETENLYLIH